MPDVMSAILILYGYEFRIRKQGLDPRIGLHDHQKPFPADAHYAAIDAAFPRPYTSSSSHKRKAAPIVRAAFFSCYFFTISYRLPAIRCRLFLPASLSLSFFPRVTAPCPFAEPQPAVRQPVYSEKAAFSRSSQSWLFGCPPRHYSRENRIRFAPGKIPPPSSPPLKTPKPGRTRLISDSSGGEPSASVRFPRGPSRPACAP